MRIMAPRGKIADAHRRREAAEALRGVFERDPSRSMADELIAERRAEARAESREESALRRLRLA